MMQSSLGPKAIPPHPIYRDPQRLVNDSYLSKGFTSPFFMLREPMYNFALGRYTPVTWEGKIWYPCRDSNPGTRFRKPLLYPPELQGHRLRLV